MKKILIIAYHFHPDLQIGAMRSVKFAKYLPQLGWEPIIVTVDSRFYQNVDSSPLEFDCLIHRTSKLPTVDDLYRKIKCFFQRDLSAKNPIAAQESKESKLAGSGSTPKHSVWKRFFNSLSWTPDNEIGWLFPGILKAIKAAHRNKVDVIFSSGPPWTCHLIGLVCKKLTGTKWIADFRDPWTPWDKLPEYKTIISDRFEKYLEKKVVLNSDLVLTTSPELMDVMKRLYFPKLENKCHFIFNGYDEEDFNNRTSQLSVPTNKKRFLYAGTLYAGRNPSGFLTAIGLLLSERFLQEKDISVDFIGNQEINLSEYFEIIEKYHLENIVKFQGPVGRQDYLDKIVNSDVLILMQSDIAPTQIPAKAFEYLASHNDIIALVGKGATYNLLKNLENVFIADPDNVDEIKERIKSIMNRAGKTAYGSKCQEAEKWTKRKLTEELSHFLDNLLTR